MIDHCSCANLSYLKAILYTVILINYAFFFLDNENFGDLYSLTSIAVMSMIVPSILASNREESSSMK